MLTQFRKKIVQTLWTTYRDNTLQMKIIESGLQKKGITQLFLDHFAVIDLPGPASGIPVLKEIFSTLGFIERGKDYLADKQNDFLWMAESDCFDVAANEVLPQVVIADFRLEEMPVEVRKIIEKYSSQTKPLDSTLLHKLMEKISHQDTTAENEAHAMITQYLAGRDWPLPTTSEFYTVKEFNELIAWVLVFGRRPNHFTLSVHLLEIFEHLKAFNQFVENELRLNLNVEGGSDVKGGKHTGIAQGSTAGIIEKVKLQDGEINIPTGFVEFVWRYPQQNVAQKPKKWNDFFTGFIAQHADRVIESLYVND